MKRISSAALSRKQMSRPNVFHDGRSLRTVQQSPIMMPMPKLVEASTNILWSIRDKRRISGRMIDGEVNCDRHHFKSVDARCGGYCRSSSLSWVNCDVKLEREARWDRPRVQTKATWHREPWIFCTMFRVTRPAARKSSTRRRYFRRFSSGIATVRSQRFHRKPIETSSNWKPLVPFSLCQGMVAGVRIVRGVDQSKG